MHRGVHILFALVVAGASGCAHHQLRWDTIKQSETLTTIYEQQVLDNLAMFVYDHNSLPFFAFPNAGGSNVNDVGGWRWNIFWSRAASGFASSDMGLNGTRSLTESWTLTPVTDPRKLELMRCAFQKSASACTSSGSSGTCPNCERAFAKFYTGNPGGAIPDQATGNGSVTSECLGADCWFGFGCKKCVPKHCRCLKVGHYCGVYVWVMPHGQDELTKLTLAILDYAIYSAAAGAPKPTKEVTWYFDASGKPSNSANAVRVEKATIPLQAVGTADTRGVTSVQAIDGNKLEPAEIPEPVRTPIPNSNYLEFEQNMRTLTPQPR